MANRKKRIPKIGDRVATEGRKGTFVIYSVNSGICAADLKQIGSDFALSTIPWRTLTFLDELDETQNALRIVRESTEGK